MQASHFLKGNIIFSFLFSHILIMCYCFFDRCSLNYRRKKLKKKSRHRLYLRQKKYAEFKNKENVFDLYFTSTCKELFFEKNVRILKQYKNNHKTIIQKKEEKEETRKWEGW